MCYSIRVCFRTKPLRANTIVNPLSRNEIALFPILAKSRRRRRVVGGAPPEILRTAARILLTCMHAAMCFVSQTHCVRQCAGGSANKVRWMTDELLGECETKAPARLVESFLYALHVQDWDTAFAAIDEEIVYHNVGYPSINGRRRFMKFWHRIFDRPSAGFEAKIHRIAAEGTSVLTERTDVGVFGPFRMHFWVCGVFEVRNGKITLWRDYFDVLDMLKALCAG
jgi:limonene-1,2-epoxide hydrolase